MAGGALRAILTPLLGRTALPRIIMSLAEHGGGSDQALRFSLRLAFLFFGCLSLQSCPHFAARFHLHNILSKSFGIHLSSYVLYH